MAWYNCDVHAAGPSNDGNIYISLADQGGAFGPTWFTALAAKQKEMLATALSAMAANFPVAVVLPDSPVPPAANSVISTLYTVSTNH